MLLVPEEGEALYLDLVLRAEDGHVRVRFQPHHAGEGDLGGARVPADCDAEVHSQALTCVGAPGSRLRARPRLRLCWAQVRSDQDVRVDVVDAPGAEAAPRGAQS